jgi:hypothetical protein
MTDTMVRRLSCDKNGCVRTSFSGGSNELDWMRISPFMIGPVGSEDRILPEIILCPVHADEMPNILVTI